MVRSDIRTASDDSYGEGLGTRLYIGHAREKPHLAIYTCEIGDLWTNLKKKVEFSADTDAARPDKQWIYLHDLTQKMFKYLTEIPNFIAVRECYILIKDSLPHFGTQLKLGSPMPFLAREKQCLDMRLNWIQHETQDANWLMALAATVGIFKLNHCGF